MTDIIESMRNALGDNQVVEEAEDLYIGNDKPRLQLQSRKKVMSSFLGVKNPQTLKLSLDFLV